MPKREMYIKVRLAFMWRPAVFFFKLSFPHCAGTNLETLAPKSHAEWSGGNAKQSYMEHSIKLQIWVDSSYRKIQFLKPNSRIQPEIQDSN